MLDLAHDTDNSQIGRAIAWVDGQDNLRAWLKVIESGVWLDWPSGFQAEFLSQMPPVLVDYHRFMN